MQIDNTTPNTSAILSIYIYIHFIFNLYSLAEYRNDENSNFGKFLHVTTYLYRARREGELMPKHPKTQLYHTCCICFSEYSGFTSQQFGGNPATAYRTIFSAIKSYLLWNYQRILQRASLAWIIVCRSQNCEIAECFVSKACRVTKLIMNNSFHYLLNCHSLPQISALKICTDGKLNLNTVRLYELPPWKWTREWKVMDKLQIRNRAISSLKNF